ncbi:unnamed protein product [Heterobilharzia americana]|nr:unnamed protein product [Heterobilharzia americana]
MDSQLDLVQKVRHITETATVQGVPSFPTGVPFTFVEHYIYLVRETAIAFGIFCGVIVVAGLILFSSPITVLLLVVIGAVGGTCSAIIGLVLLDLALNPISACLLLLSGGLGARISAGFLGLWPVSHLYMDSSPSRSTRKLCLCQSNLSYGCPSDAGQFCAHVESGKREPKQVILSESPSSVHKTITNISKRRQLVRAQIVRILINHFTPAFHATVGLLLALSLLVAARVQFIADYFFRLIVIVSFICLFNAVCFIPTICYLIGPLHSRFIVGGRRSISNNSTPYKSSLKSDSHLTEDKHIHQYLKSAATSSRVNGNQEHQQINVINDSQSSFSSSSSSNMSPNSSSPSSSRSSSSYSQSEFNPTDEINQNTKPYCKTESSYKECTYSGLRESNKDIVHHSLKYPSHHSMWMNSTSEQCSSDAAATAAAAAVVVAAAAAASVRSRPPSLSTISEEPSHSNSTVSLNHTTPSNTGQVSASNSSSSSNTGFLPTTENANIPSNPTSPSKCVHHSVKHDLTLHNLPLSLVSSVDFITMSKLLNPNISANEICESLYSSIISPVSSNSHTSARSNRGSKSKEFVLNPDVACSLLAAVTATNCKAAYKKVGELSCDGQAENTPPPPYSSVISQPYSNDSDKCSKYVLPKSYRQKLCTLSDTQTHLPDKKTSLKSHGSSHSIHKYNSQSPIPGNIRRSNSYATSSLSSKTCEPDDHQVKKKTVPTELSSYSTHIKQSAPIDSNSVSKLSQLPLTGSSSSTANSNVNMRQIYHHYKQGSPDFSNTQCTTECINKSNTSYGYNISYIHRQQSTSHSSPLTTHSNSQKKKQHNVQIQ